MRPLRPAALAAGALLLGAFLLAGCQPAPRSSEPGLRRPGTMIASAVMFDPARFSGDWVVAQSGRAGCAGTHQSWIWNGQDRFALSGGDCSGTGALSALSGAAHLTGPGGRMQPDRSFQGEPIWVLWVDQDYRVAVLGTPSGRFLNVLARPQALGRGDLLTAAREVADFNGYDLNRITR